MPATLPFNPDGTIVIADFDGTFTRKEVGERKISSLLSILVDEKYLGADGKAEAEHLFAQYYPIETNPHIAQEEKTVLMQEWWEKSASVLVEKQITLEMIHEVVTSEHVQFRNQLTEFLSYLHQHEVPLIIFSAGGIGQDGITHLLMQRQLLTPNITIVSNRLEFDEQQRITAIQQPIIHIANKTGQTLVNAGVIAAQPMRQNCLLLGDTIDDIRMSEGIAFDSIYRVAFAKPSPHFDEAFDLVLPFDGEYGPVCRLFQD